MELTQTISALIFALILIAVVVYVVMSRFVTGPLAELKRGERVILSIGVVGICWSWCTRRWSCSSMSCSEGGDYVLRTACCVRMNA